MFSVCGKIQAYNLFIGIINLVVFESPIYYGMVNPLPIMLGKGANGTPIRVAPNIMARGL
jgi:hypothetical protein